jgi:hypothetical protein
VACSPGDDRCNSLARFGRGRARPLLPQRDVAELGVPEGASCPTLAAIAAMSGSTGAREQGDWDARRRRRDIAQTGSDTTSA